MKNKEKRGIFANIGSLLATTAKAAGIDLKKTWQYISKPKARKQLMADFWNFLKRWWQLITRERVMREAGSLTYITILGFVPFVVFILLIAPDLPFLNLREKLFSIISDHLIPTSAFALNSVIEGMLEGRAGFNAINFIVMMVSSYSLFRVIRDSFDRILKMEFKPRQSPFQQLIKFLGTIILGVFILAILLSSSSLPMISRLLKLPLLNWITYLIPFAMQFFLLVFLYTLMPSIKVERMSLVRGAFWTAIIWLLVKSGFDFYIYRMTSYHKFYGTLSALPIFLLWIYVNWLIILSGIVMVAVFEDKTNADDDKPQNLARVCVELFSDGKLQGMLEKTISSAELKKLLKQSEEEK
ncbi:MAG: YihY/virulence factor BrkB family protein [Candidatus Cloacimonetes bacterium]|nr:YihY/virulence factor BrkB family protein [Candidatus Cloacimonadota bacterium]